MKTNYDTIIEKVNAGYVIRPEHYQKENVTIYQLVKHLSETERTVHCELPRNIAMKLKKEAGAKIEPTIEVVALNFIPVAVKANCVRFPE